MWKGCYGRLESLQASAQISTRLAMGEVPTTNGIDLPLPVIEANSTQYASHYAEAAAMIDQMIAKIDETSREIDAVLAATTDPAAG
jgi:hypothetical protein